MVDVSTFHRRSAKQAGVIEGDHTYRLMCSILQFDQSTTGEDWHGIFHARMLRTASSV